MSEDPEDKRILERMKAERELLAEFGAQLHGSDPGISAYLASKDFGKQTVKGQGRGYFGEDLSFTVEDAQKAVADRQRGHDEALKFAQECR